ncbi:MAG: DnaD domain protein [Bacilli bacterium]|jgi:DnaD/phage-associated family protein|nr:DnaD domain protein [Bacilli bacterium]
MFNYERFLNDLTINKKELLLNNYNLIDLNETEVVILLLIQDMIDLNVLVTNTSLKNKMSVSKKIIDNHLEKLINKKCITFDKYSSHNNIDISGVYHQIMAKLIESDITTIKDHHHNKFSQLIMNFKNEFNRELSPLEIEKLDDWYNKYEITIINKSLEKAVLSGILNFNNINKIILRDIKNGQ